MVYYNDYVNNAVFRNLQAQIQSSCLGQVWPQEYVLWSRKVEQPPFAHCHKGNGVQGQFNVIMKSSPRYRTASVLADGQSKSEAAACRGTRASHASFMFALSSVCLVFVRFVFSSVRSSYHQSAQNLARTHTHTHREEMSTIQAR